MEDQVPAEAGRVNSRGLRKEKENSLGGGSGGAPPHGKERDSKVFGQKGTQLHQKRLFVRQKRGETG